MIKLTDDLYIDMVKDCLFNGMYKCTLSIKNKVGDFTQLQSFWGFKDCVDCAIDYTIKRRIKDKASTFADVIKIAQEVNEEFKEIKEVCKNL